MRNDLGYIFGRAKPPHRVRARDAVDHLLGLAFEEQVGRGRAGRDRVDGDVPARDPVQDLRNGFDLHVEFGLTHPAHYLLMYDRRIPGETSAAAQRSADRLHMLVERIAAAGRLAVTVESAAAMIHSAGSGLTYHLIGTPPDERDPELPGRLREAVLSAVTGDAPPSTPDYPQHATALKATLGQTEGLLTAGEQALLDELLDRLGNPPLGR